MSLTAQLETVNITELRKFSRGASQKVAQAAKEQGIFYLDLTDDNLSSNGNIEGVAALSEEIFQLPFTEKMQFDVDKLGEWKINGYKPVGRNVGGLPGQRDGFESYGGCFQSLNYLIST
ncbi:oxidoreductase [Penicillium canariense]|uniref:Oxidoreductase n=1 Tax=Penicillium canariense TaxID=189055 RepID=A0A9W9ID06_9EURO|nr:oxidoreductase [Penicillium canariense]KAJ5175403.1 oxidoreductase [Penicillium canariense]